MKVTRKNLAMLVILGVLTMALYGCGGSEPAKPAAPAKVETKFPERAINLAVWASAGGGTDQVNRLLAALMEKEIGGKIQVSNMTGGMGGIASSWVWDAPHDGYRWVGASETLLPMPVNGAHKTTTKDWEYFIAAGSPGVLVVPKDSPYKTFDDLVKAAKAEPGKIKISNSGVGGLWHMKANVIAKYAGVPFGYAPYQGSRPAIVAALSKEVQAAAASAGEVIEFVKSGQMRPLVMLEKDDFDFPGVGKVPAVTKTFPQLEKYFPLNQWLGFMIPADTPKPVIEKIEKAYKAAMKDPKVAEWAKVNVSVVYGLSGKEAKEMAAKQESKMAWMLQEWGIAKESPEKFGIPKP